MKSNRLTNRQISLIVTFGTAWGISEITLGMLLHNIHVPFNGLILTFIGSILALTCVKLTGKKRSLIYTATVAAILKMISFTTIKTGPVAGILFSAMLAQSVLYLMQTNSISIIIASGLMCSWPPLQLLLYQMIIYTPDILKIYSDILDKTNIKGLNIWIVLIMIFIIHFAAGILAGAVSIKYSARLIKEFNILEKA